MKTKNNLKNLPFRWVFFFLNLLNQFFCYKYAKLVVVSKKTPLFTQGGLKHDKKVRITIFSKENIIKTRTHSYAGLNLFKFDGLSQPII